MVTTSESICPIDISLSDDRCVKPGARIFNLYGLLAPSEIKKIPNSPFGA